MNPTTPEQKKRAEERRAKFKVLLKQVADMPETDRLALSARLGIITCQGQALSPRNQCLLAFQFPQVSVVGGFRQWLSAGRCVRRGEHGHMIWVPSVHERKTSTGDGTEPAEPAEAADVRFLIGTVFDISQTEAMPPHNATPAGPLLQLQAA